MRLHAVLEKAQKAGITLKMDKCEFTRQTEMEAPKNVSELRSFLGMVNQLGRFIPDLAEKDKVFQDLLSKTNHWYWGIKQQAAFDQLKKGAVIHTSALQPK